MSSSSVRRYFSNSEQVFPIASLSFTAEVLPAGHAYAELFHMNSLGTTPVLRRHQFHP